MNRFFRLAYATIAPPGMIMAAVLAIETHAQSQISFVDTSQRLGGNANANDIALADIDRDGDLDAIIAISGGPNKLWLNSGAGTFSDSGRELGQDALGVALGDIDADSDLDIVFLNDGAGALRLWNHIGSASGNFIADTAPGVGGDLGSAIAFGNIAGDTRPDIFLTRNLGRPDEVCVTIGAGTFYSSQNLGAESGSDVALGDLDGDGDLDAFVANGNADKIWINQSGAQGGVFGNFLTNGQSLGTSLTLAVALGDVDGDGDLDALVGESAPQLDRIWINQGGAQSGTAGIFLDRLLGSSAAPAVGQTRDVALGDLDGDGDLDAVLARSTSSAIYQNNGSGAFADSGLNLGTAAETVALGDFDGDGDLDVFLVPFGAPAQVWLNQTSLPLPTLPEYRITTFAGNGAASADGDNRGDGGPAIDAQLQSPRFLAVDSQGSVYIGDELGERIRKVAPDGTISTIIRSQFSGFGGDGGPVGSAVFAGIRGAALDAANNLYLSDARNNRVRRVDSAGIVTTFAGTNEGGFAGDGGPAALAKLASPLSVAVDRLGQVYFFDIGSYRIRRVDTNGIITTIAGTGTSGFSGDGGPATNAQIDHVVSLAVDRPGNIYFVDDNKQRIRKIDPSGIITTVAGTGQSGVGGGGGPATAALLDRPWGIAVDDLGNLFLSDKARVRRVDTNGFILTVAGGRYGFSGDGAPALQSGLDQSVFGMALLPNGDLLFCDGDRVRRLSPTGNTVPVFRKFVSTPPPGSRTDFGTKEQNFTGSWPSSPIYINNLGTASFTIQSVELLGDTAAFRVTVQDASYDPISLPYQIPEGNTGDGVTVNLECILPPSSAVSTNTATLRIVTSDPETPVATFTLQATIIPPAPVDPGTNNNTTFESTLEETLLFLYLFPGARSANIHNSDAHRARALSAQSLPEQATFLLDAALPHSVTSQVPSFLGGGSVVISNFTGRVTLSTRPIPNDSNQVVLVVEGGTFTAPSFSLPSGVATGTNTLTFGPPSQSDGRLNLTNGNYTASASATIVNDLFPNGFPVQGTYSGTFDFAQGRASVQSRSTDIFARSTRLEYLRTLTAFVLTWAAPGVLETATNVLGPWTPRSNAVSPHSLNPSQNSREFFRLRSDAQAR